MATSKQRKNRQRRRKGQAAGDQKPRPVPVPERILFPDQQQPLVEVHIALGTSPEVKDLCVAYWAFQEAGVWERKVSELGSAHLVLKQVKAASRASLLTLVCPGCASPSTVASRSEVQATGYWRPGEFPTTPVETKTLCVACRDAAAAAKAEEAAAAEAAQEEQRQRRLDNASAWMARQKDLRYAEENPDTLGALTILAICDIMERTGKDAVGPLKDLPYTLTGSAKRDTDTIDVLFGQRWIMPTLPATTSDFAYNDDDTVSGVYLAYVPWALATWLGDGPEALTEARDCMRAALERNVDRVRGVVLDLETGIAIDYLEGLLTRKYREEPIPEHRLPDAHATIRAALAAGFTLGQVVAVCWSAAAGSVAWGQRTRGLKAGSVSAAAVTNLDRRIGYAKDRPVVEYDLPNWVERPAIHATALRWLQEHGAAAETLKEFRALQQRINSRPLDAIELDDDLASSPPSFNDFLDALKESTPVPDSGPRGTFAVVHPDGTLTVDLGTVSTMRRIAGEPYSMAERIIIEGTRGLVALVPECADSTAHPTNPMGAAMLGLLGAGEGPIRGNVVFCGADAGNRLGGLTDDLRDLVGLAHEAAKRLTVS